MDQGGDRMLIFTKRLTMCVAGAMALFGCHAPGGGFLPFTGGSSTYYSTESRPTTITLIDTNTEEAIFSIEIPVGKQLSLDFVADAGDDSVLTPDLMRYQIFEIGTRVGRLRNALTVPGAASRRIDVTFRQAPEMAIAPPDEALRSDQPQGEATWWTPQGGQLPPDAGRTIYDD